MNISPFLSVNHSCDEALRWATQQLSQASLRPVQTFDLHTARLALHDSPCPNHGTNACDCQMIVMLVYGKAHEPVTLILHGNAGQTWVSLADSSHPRPDAELVNAIQSNTYKRVFRNIEKCILVFGVSSLIWGDAVVYSETGRNL